MIADEFEESTVGHMDVAQERACQHLPRKLADSPGFSLPALEAHHRWQMGEYRP
jgi:hypothetical protein